MTGSLPRGSSATSQGALYRLEVVLVARFFDLWQIWFPGFMYSFRTPVGVSSHSHKVQGKLGLPRLQ